MELANHIGLTCKDLAATEAWYTKHFGFKRARVIDTPDVTIIFLKMLDSAFYLELFKADQESPIDLPEKDGYTFPGYRHIAFKVDSVDAKLKELGDDAKITLGPADFDVFIPGWRTVWVSDPDGRIVEITEGFKDEDNPPAP